MINVEEHDTILHEYSDYILTRVKRIPYRHDGQRCPAFSRVSFVKKLFGKVELASSKMCVRTSRPITWMVPPWPRYVQACVDIKELPPGCNFDVVSYCCTTLNYPFCCKTQAGQGNLMRLHEGNLKCSLGKLYQGLNGSTIFNLYIILIFVICGQQPAAAVLYLGSGCFSRQGIFGGFTGDRQNYRHSWCSRRTRSFESSLGCNTTTFKPSKTIQNTSNDQTFRASCGSNLKKHEETMLFSTQNSMTFACLS